MRRTFLLPVIPFLLFSLSMAQVSIVGELSQDRDARPGDQYQGTILVRNDTDEPQEAKVYQTDYLFFSDGTNRYDEPGSHPRSNAQWITFSPAYITLPPHATVNVSFSVLIPAASATPLAGTYWSMLMIEGIPKSSPESSRRDAKAEMGIMQSIRYGIQIATHIAGTGSRMIEFENPRVVAREKGGKVFQIDVKNIADLGMRPEVYLELFNEQGVSLGKYVGIRYRIYPGTSVRQSIDLSSVPKGSYKALVVVDAGGEDVFGAQYTLQL
ncbi:MAG: hypothetical protein HY563_03115 [Ignavibacteriales bacterium]|nr:hypothetical protein [Ignavibacteriales bacterium]